MTDPVQVLRSCAALALLWLFWHYGWRSLVLDRTRQRLFELRDQLFNLALRRENGFAFDSPAYGTLRNSLNSNIRFAHRVTFYHIWVAMLFGLFNSSVQREMKDFKSQATIAIEAVKDEELRKKLQAVQAKAYGLRLEHLFLTSPLFLVITGIAAICITVRIVVSKGLAGSLKAFGRLWKEEFQRKELGPSARAVQFQTEALGIEEPELCAA